MFSRCLFDMMFFSLHICCLLLHICAATQQEILNRILSLNYDVNDSPRASSSHETDVHVQLYINSFGSPNAANMDYDLDTFIRQKWRDTRLAYKEKTPYVVIQDAQIRRKIWTPDTYFENVKDAKIHMVTMPNFLFRFDQNGNVLYSMRVRMTVACAMKLHRFPFDNHDCHLTISSYSNTEDVIQYHWNDKYPITLPDDLEIPEFDLLDYKTQHKTFHYATGNFSGLTVRFTMRRQNGYHILQTYVPTILIVSMSWISFWIEPTAVPGRVTLGVTTLLTLTTLASGIRQQLPPVSYMKAIDLWIGMCMIMVFGALLEFTLANWLANKKIRSEKVSRKIVQFQMSQSIMVKPPTTYITYARAVDRISRVLFPGTFFVFNFFYWPYYLLQQYTSIFVPPRIGE